MHQGFIVASAHFKTIAVGIGPCIRSVFKIPVFECPAVFSSSRNVVGSPQVAVPAVVNIKPGAAAIKIITGAHIELGCEPISITIIRWVGIIVRIAVNNFIIRRSASQLQPGIPVFIKFAVFDNVITAFRNIHPVIASTFYADTFNMPVTGGKANPLVTSALCHSRTIEQYFFTQICPQVYHCTCSSTDSYIYPGICNKRTTPHKYRVTSNCKPYCFADGLKRSINCSCIRIAAIGSNKIYLSCRY